MSCAGCGDCGRRCGYAFRGIRLRSLIREAGLPDCRSEREPLWQDQSDDGGALLEDLDRSHLMRARRRRTEWA